MNNSQSNTTLTKPTNKKPSYFSSSSSSSSQMTTSFHQSKSNNHAPFSSFTTASSHHLGRSGQNGESGGSAHGQATNMSNDQIIELMGQVNAAVKSSEFNTQLSNNIFALCQQLKANGQKLEQTNKNDLNKVFVSLRQACCRDNGQLGTPCRLKIMELIELRAMGWKSSLAHTQYYLNKPEKTPKSPADHVQPTAQFAQSAAAAHSHPQRREVPTSAANFSAPTVSQPTSQHPAFVATAPPPNFPPQFTNAQFSFAQQPPPLFVPSDIPATSAQPTPGYFLIPAAGGWTPQMVPAGMIPTSQFAQPAALQMRPAQPPPDWMTRLAAPFAKMDRPNPMIQSAYSLGMNTKANKQPQLREEITIKNADSGKIMGVKGRRVAVVEELSGTVISFQKVEGTSRFRTLAITGSTSEAIGYAKRLIDETIKRNVSPNRLDLNGEFHQSTSGHESIAEGGPNGNGDQDSGEEEGAEDEEDDAGISIEAGQDGTLKVSCADPEMLQAAQQALTEYLTLRNNRMTAEERELRKERRKSMPLQSTAAGNTAASSVGNQPKSNEPPAPPQPGGSSWSETRRQHLGSSPNLLVDEQPAAPKIPQSNVQRYERSKMLEIRSNVAERLSDFPQVDTNEMRAAGNDKAEEEGPPEDTN